MSSMNAILDRARQDTAYRARLKSEPIAVLQEAGISVPAGKQLEVIEERPDELHLLLGGQPPSPALGRLLERAEKDLAFRKQLLAEPRPQVEAALGQALPAGMKVCFHERQADRLFLMLPAARQAEGELSDAELETVAGGTVFQRITTGLKNLFCPNTTVTFTNIDKNGHGASASYVDYSATNSGDNPTTSIF